MTSWEITISLNLFFVLVGLALVGLAMTGIGTYTYMKYRSLGDRTINGGASVNIRGWILGDPTISAEAKKRFLAQEQEAMLIWHGDPTAENAFPGIQEQVDKMEFLEDRD